MSYLVYYQKANGDIIERKRTSMPDYKVGQTTSMGWLVKDIKYISDGKVYNSYDEYFKYLDKERDHREKIQAIKNIFSLKHFIKKIDVSGLGWVAVILLFIVK